MRMRCVIGAVLVALLVTACGPQGTGGPSPSGGAASSPRAGGTLTYIVASEPPSFDGHKETSYALLHPFAPFYSLLYRFDPNDLTKVVPDVAAELPQLSADKLTWTVKLRTNVKFHDGSQMTSADVKATYDRITNPPAGVTSARRAAYNEIESVGAPDPGTVTLKLKYPSGSLLSKLASPWNFIYSAAKLKDDPRWPEKNILGTGPFTFVKYEKGAYVEGKKNPDYFIPGRPYLDGFRAVFIVDPTAQVNAVRGGQADIEFRGFTPTQRDQIKQALGDKVTVQENSWVCVNYITPNAKYEDPVTKKKPFADVRVRQALTLAIDRWKGGALLSKTTIVKDVGGLFRPGSAFATPEADLVKLAGYGKDGAAAKEQAKKLLKDAGFEGLTFKFLNRNTPTPYEPVALFIIDEWKQIGLNVTHDVKETSAYQGDMRAGNYQVGLDFNCDYLDEPDLQLAKFYSPSGLGKGLNFTGVDDSKLDDMMTAQSKETDATKRLALLREIEKYAVDTMAYQTPAIWWYRIVPHSSRVKGWSVGSNHYTNQDLMNVWLAEP